ncbi:TonB-dependent receptor [Glaciecola sp. MH2013]|uniref:TonB-dependent receptor plug domain-containing protein n=1 Tax=Glaciecola sp. MH2013 TaxID=2785524 RepID=UPI00189DD1F7|nr:TonB-dependent receptor [Glaciecola sp. MH2013]MBF7071904.1 TonB-dependent receptor [Glaciecola sp. MH2013]
MKLKLSTLALCLGVSHLAHAQTQLSTSIEKISITGSRAPIDKSSLAGSVSFIDEATIEASGATSLTDLLRRFASVNVSQSGPTGTLTELRFRGSESNHILVLVDGVEINDLGQGGLVNFAHLLVSDIQEIELLRGPQSALWGTSAVSGVISITTKRARSGQAFSANLGLGNQATKQLGLNYSKATDALKFSLNANHFNTDGANISLQGDEKDGYENTSISSNLEYDVNDEHKIVANLRFVDFISEFDGVDFVNTGLPTDADNNSEGQTLSSLLRWVYQPKGSMWSQSLAYQVSNNASDNFSSGIFSGGTEGQTQRLTWLNFINLSSLGHTKNKFHNFINFGLDAVEEDFEQSGPIGFGDPNQEQNNTTLSVLSDGQYAIFEQTYLSASFRRDNSDEFDNANSFRLGLSSQLSTDVKVFVSRGKAIKNPSFTERFGFFAGTFIGNPALRPESSYSNEVGLEYQANKAVNMELTYFDTALRNEINGFVFDASTGGFTADNIDEQSTREGVELTLAGDYKNLQWSASYAYLDSKAPTEVELRRARHTGSISLNYAFSEAHRLYLQGDYSGSKTDRFFPPFPLPSEVVKLAPYWLVSANYSAQLNKEWGLSIRVDNLFDEGYQDVFGFVGQPRRVMANIQYEWN